MNVAYDPQRPWLGGNAVGGDPNTWSPRLWDWLIERFDLKSIVDVGCGEGYLMQHFLDNGVIVYGVDGLEANKENAPRSVRDRIEINDYRESIGPVWPVDMTISCEFVEHIRQKDLVNVLHQFTAGKYLTFTHAIPGQIGHHHVNCKDERYWIDLMRSVGMSYLNTDTIKARELGYGHWQTTLIFQNEL